MEREIKILKPDGETELLGSLVKYELKSKPRLIARQGGQRAVTIICKTENYTGSEVLKQVTPTLEKLKKTWPGGYAYAFAGEAEDSAETFGSASVMMIVSIFLVFGLLLIQFNSISQPFIIMMTVLG